MQWLWLLFLLVVVVEIERLKKTDRNVVGCIPPIGDDGEYIIVGAPDDTGDHDGKEGKAPPKRKGRGTKTASGGVAGGGPTITGAGGRATTRVSAGSTRAVAVARTAGG